MRVAEDEEGGPEGEKKAAAKGKPVAARRRGPDGRRGEADEKLREFSEADLKDRAERIQAGLPKGWRLAHKTGTGDYGRANDVAIAWPPDSAPLVLAVMSERRGYHTPPVDALVAQATKQVVADLR